jgi:methionyl-tRNA formyltransferase
LRIVFMGTPDFAVPALKALAAAGHAIVAAYSQPPRPAGRGMAERKLPVQLAAEAMGVPVLTPASLRGDAEQAIFSAHRADIAVVAAYGLILPPAILAAPGSGCWNIHASLLPRWRGAAPIQRAILAGDDRTGISIMKMEAGLDTGPVALMKEIKIGENETAGQLHDRLAALGAQLIVEAVGLIESGRIEPRPQSPKGVTYAAKIDKAEARIDWRRPAGEVHNHIRGLSPFPGAWFETGDGKSERIKVLASELATGNGAPGTVLDDRLTVACGDGAVRLTRLQRAGRLAQDAAEFLRGARITAGSRLA